MCLNYKSESRYKYGENADSDAPRLMGSPSQATSRLAESCEIVRTTTIHRVSVVSFKDQGSFGVCPLWMDKYLGSWRRPLHELDRGVSRCDPKRGQREVAGEFSVLDPEGMVFEAACGCIENTEEFHVCLDKGMVQLGDSLRGYPAVLRSSRISSLSRRLYSRLTSRDRCCFPRLCASAACLGPRAIQQGATSVACTTPTAASQFLLRVDGHQSDLLPSTFPSTAPMFELLLSHAHFSMNVAASGDASPVSRSFLPALKIRGTTVRMEQQSSNSSLPSDQSDTCSPTRMAMHINGVCEVITYASRLHAWRSLGGPHSDGVDPFASALPTAGAAPAAPRVDIFGR